MFELFFWKRPKFNFSLLPAEVLWKILKLIGNLRDQNQLMLVCSKFRDIIARDRWRRICYLHFNYNGRYWQVGTINYKEWQSVWENLAKFSKFMTELSRKASRLKSLSLTVFVLCDSCFQQWCTILDAVLTAVSSNCLTQFHLSFKFCVTDRNTWATPKHFRCPLCKLISTIEALEWKPRDVSKILAPFLHRFRNQLIDLNLQIYLTRQGFHDISLVLRDCSRLRCLILDRNQTSELGHLPPGSVSNLLFGKSELRDFKIVNCIRMDLMADFAACLVQSGVRLKWFNCLDWPSRMRYPKGAREFATQYRHWVERLGRREDHPLRTLKGPIWRFIFLLKDLTPNIYRPLEMSTIFQIDGLVTRLEIGRFFKWLIEFLADYFLFASEKSNLVVGISRPAPRFENHLLRLENKKDAKDSLEGIKAFLEPESIQSLHSFGNFILSPVRSDITISFAGRNWYKLALCFMKGSRLLKIMVEQSYQ